MNTQDNTIIQNYSNGTYKNPQSIQKTVAFAKTKTNTYKIILLSSIVLLTFSCKSDDDQNQNQLFSPPDFILGTYINDGTGEINTISFTQNNIIIDFECCQWQYNFNQDFNSTELNIEESTNDSGTSYTFAISGPSNAFPTNQSNLCLDPEGDCEFSLSFQLGALQTEDNLGIFLNGPGFIDFFLTKQ